MKFQEKKVSIIKLIIWDLDETFWKGTLSDNVECVSVTPIEEHIQLIKKLVHRGILNAVCSKNDALSAEEELKRQGVLDFFVFNSIDWTPKGERIKRLVSDMSLRETNVLFIDDNPSNLAEVEFLCPELMVASPEVIPYLAQCVDTLGKDDPGLTRLKQYRVLEQKREDAKIFSSNEEFLKNSDIRICFLADLRKDTGRIAELIARSNQLNFTKKRITEQELSDLLSDKDVDAGAVMVADNYGMYGLVGFYAMRKGVLEHFLFSCRTMGMGIEQYVYAYLGYPTLAVVPPVSGSVSKDGGQPSYIRRVDTLEEKQEKEAKSYEKILLKGPCDLQVMASFIEKSGREITTEFNFIDQKGNQVDFYNHSLNLLNILTYSEQEWRALCDKYPFLSSEAYKSTLFSERYDVVCLSPLMDATLAVYTDKNDFHLPFGLYNKPLTNSQYWDEYLQKTVMTARNCFDQESLELFSGQFKSVPYSAKDIADNYARVIDTVLKKNPRTRFVILLLSELPFHYPKHSSFASWAGKEQTHMEINSALRDVFRGKDYVYLLDVNRYIKSQADYFDNIHHYSKLVYYKMAKEFIEFVNSLGGEIAQKNYLQVIWGHLKRTVYKTFFLRIR